MILTSAYLDKKLLFLLIMGILFAGFVQKVYGLLREKIYSACAIGFSKNDIGDQFCNCNLFFCHRLLLSGEGNIR